MPNNTEPSKGKDEVTKPMALMMLCLLAIWGAVASFSKPKTAPQAEPLPQQPAPNTAPANNKPSDAPTALEDATQVRNRLVEQLNDIKKDKSSPNNALFASTFLSYLSKPGADTELVKEALDWFCLHQRLDLRNFNLLLQREFPEVPIRGTGTLSPPR